MPGERAENHAERELDRDGFEVLRNALPLDRVAELTASIDAWLSRAGGPDQRSRPCARNLLACPAVMRFATSGHLARVLRPLLDGPPRVVRGLLFDKRPRHNWRVGWHQDQVTAFANAVEAAGFSGWTTKEGVVHARAPAGLLARMVTLRLHLDDCDSASGPIEFLPRTHSSGLLTSEQVASLLGSRDSVVCTASAGDAVLMRPLVLHASAKVSAATPARRRRVLHLEYAGCDPPRGVEWPTWQAETRG